MRVPVIGGLKQVLKFRGRVRGDIRNALRYLNILLRIDNQAIASGKLLKRVYTDAQHATAGQAATDLASLLPMKVFR